jgi:hypothetical protein
MTTSSKYGIPYIATSQASPEVTHNGAINFLQILSSQVKGLLNAPPGGPADGDVYIVGAAPTGAWAGRANALAGYFGTGWLYIPNVDSSGTPIAMGAAHKGLRRYDQTLLGYRRWDGAAWGIDYDLRISSYKAAAPVGSEVLVGYTGAEAWSLPANLTGSKVTIGTAATGTPVIDVQKNGISCGSITVTGTVPAYATTAGAAVAFAVGDVFTLVAPGVADATMAKIAATINAQRTI